MLQRVWLVLVLVLVLVIEKPRKTEQENKKEDEKEPDPTFSKHALLAPVTSGTPFGGTNPTHAVFKEGSAALTLTAGEDSLKG